MVLRHETSIARGCLFVYWTEIGHAEVDIEANNVSAYNRDVFYHLSSYYKLEPTDTKEIFNYVHFYNYLYHSSSFRLCTQVSLPGYFK